MSAYDKEILDKHHLKLREDGVLSAADQEVYDAQVKINEQIQGAERAMLANSSRAYSSRMSFSPEMERANILYEKTKKYLPTMVKQAGLSGLGVSQSMALQAQNDHLNRMNSLREVRERAASEASGLSFDDYRSYVDGLEEQSRSLDITKAKSDIEALYAGDGDEASKELGFNEILSRYSNSPDVQNSLIEYAKSHQERSSALGKLYSLFGDGTSKGGEVTPADYQAAPDAEADPWAGVDAEALFLKYYEMDEKGQAAFDDYLEALGAMSVEEKQKELGEKEALAAEIDNRIDAILKSIGEQNLTDSKIRSILENDEFAGMSDSMRKRLENARADSRFLKELYNVPGEADMATIDRAYGALLDPTTGSFATTPEKLADFLTKYPNAPTDMLDAAQDQLAALIYGSDATKDEIKAMSDEEADSYIEQLKALVNEDGTPKTELISEEFYKSYVEPEIDEFESVLGAYRAEAERIESETYQKQMAGEKSIKTADGKKWTSLGVDNDAAEKYMEKNKEMVQKEISELGYGNVKNPNIPDKTVIEVDGVGLMYDATSKGWMFVKRGGAKMPVGASILSSVGYANRVLPDWTFVKAQTPKGGEVHMVCIDGKWYYAN